jgi:hypothetical protein
VASGIYYRRVTDRIAVLAVDSWTIHAEAVVQGVGQRALIVLSRRDVRIEGVLDFSAGCEIDGVYSASCGGPGGGRGAHLRLSATGCAPGGIGFGAAGDSPDAPNAETGGGGGGFGTNGADSGTGRTTERLGPGGLVSPLMCAGATLTPLMGGSGGGAGGVRVTGDHNGGDGGGGGGAIQIGSLTGVFVDTPPTAQHPAVIDASGSGGRASGNGLQLITEGGGGGGSGGGILLEAPLVYIAPDAALVANGGGGGGGVDFAEAANGEDGLRTSARARGGLGGFEGGGQGGLGGALAGPPTQGSGLIDGTGGGGGSVGIIRINGRMISTAAAVISPAPSTGDLSP